MSSQKNEGGDSSKIVGNMPKWRELTLPTLNWGEILVNLRLLIIANQAEMKIGMMTQLDATYSAV